MALEMKYFVLKPRGNDSYARASRAAMKRYAYVVADKDRKLSNALIIWADREEKKAMARAKEEGRQGEIEGRTDKAIG